ncbi:PATHOGENESIS-RELATED FAMILY PROTEIN [Salix viminalis]|uniref:PATHOGENESIS-RELATED FAMILY PROTEIN n=1 Tax=Salix viminalis TaxID=40686 RepID=A0A9Q0Z7V6_SALVM|nr:PATHOGENESIS-RELATED FAMILY PROTEIN [Salix viminalis]
MATAEEALIKKSGDIYRSILHDGTDNTTQWRHGAPPTFDSVNQLFEEGRTKEWPKGSLEEVVQNAIKSWDMEISHKIRLQDFKTINPDKFKLIVNGRKGLSGEEILGLGSYNALLKSSLPKEFQHWGFFEGPFKGHAPTGEKVEFLGLEVLQVDESLRAEEVEIYYDAAELFGGLLKEPLISPSRSESEDNTVDVAAAAAAHGCPFSK